MKCTYQRLGFFDHITGQSMGSYLVEWNDSVAPLEPTLVQQIFCSLLSVHNYVE